MRVEISNSEIFDKMTILELKYENGLDVKRELDEFQYYFNLLLETNPSTAYLYDILKTINKTLWEIEDCNRLSEDLKTFDKLFITNTRLIYLINDERARIKRIIDNVTNSESTEIKSYAGLK